MKRITHISILIVSLIVFFSCGTTKVEVPDNESDISSPEVSSDTHNAKETEDDFDSDKLKNESNEKNVVVKTDKDDSKKHAKKAKKGSAKNQEKEEGSPEEAPVPIIPVFDDWKYMGFGAEVPDLVTEAVKESPDVFFSKRFKLGTEQGHNTVIFNTYGMNVDQAENKLDDFIVQVEKEGITESADFVLKNYELFETGWVRLNEEYFKEKIQAEGELYTVVTEQPYIAYRIYREK